MSVQERVGMPLDEFIRSYDEAPFELTDGERILLPLQVAGQAEVIRLLTEALFTHEDRASKMMFFLGMPFIELDADNNVMRSQTPKLQAYHLERWADYKRKETDWRDKPPLLIPDLCVEVISANDSYVDVDAKVERYLSDGVRLVWVFNPRQKSITVHAPDQIARLSENDTLDGGQVLPGFSVSVGALFDQQ